MPMNARENINGVTPQDLNKMNENFMSVWKTLYGGIDFDNTNVRTQNKINTQWITVQQEGNYDMGFPTYIRFYVPPDTKKLVSSSFNFLKERYRMDSGVAMGGGAVEDVEIAMSMGTTTGGIASISDPVVGVASISNPVVGVASISNPVVGVSSISSPTVGVSSQAGGGKVESLPVMKWGTSNGDNGFNRPTRKLNKNSEIVYTSYRDENSNLMTYLGDDGFGKGLVLATGYMTNGVPIDFIDLLEMQHTHKLDLPAHSHTMTVSPHTHQIVLNAHTHDVRLDSHTHEIRLDSHSHEVRLDPHTHNIILEPHTHTAVGKLDLDPHTHELNEGIKVSLVEAGASEIVLNGQTVGHMPEGLNSINDLDLTEFINIGEWNVMKISTNTLARITVYGVVEVIKS